MRVSLPVLREDVFPLDSLPKFWTEKFSSVQRKHWVPKPPNFTFLLVCIFLAFMLPINEFIGKKLIFYPECVLSMEGLVICHTSKNGSQ